MPHALLMLSWSVGWMLQTIVHETPRAHRLPLASATSADVRTERFEMLARLDLAVHYYHPTVAARRAQWDSLFAVHAPRALDAATTTQFHAHVADMLAGVGDALSVVRGDAPAGRWQTRVADDVVVYALNAGSTPRPAAPAQPVIVDLRGATVSDDSLARWLGLQTTIEQFALEYHGLPPELGQSSGGYRIAWNEVGRAPSANSRADRPLRATPDSQAARIVVLVDQRSVLPSALVNGLADRRVVLIGVDTRTVALDGVVHRIPLGGGASALVRRSKGRTYGHAVSVDTTVSRSDADGVARAIARRATLPSVGSVAERAIDPGFVTLPIRSTTQDTSPTFPSVGYRLLAAARTWNTYDHFSPYKSRLEAPWSAVLAASLPRVVSARTALEFSQALARIVAATNDGHSTLNSSALSAGFFGAMSVPLRTQFIDGQLLITRLQPALGDTSALQRGDRILRVDGTAVEELVNRFRPYVSVSTPQGRNYVLARRVLNGPPGSTAVLHIRRVDGTEREVTVRRAVQYVVEENTLRGGGVIRMLPGNIGYVDMERLPRGRSDSVYLALRQATAIIFDMRGYPQGTGFTLAPWIARAPSPVATARFARPVRPSPDSTTNTIAPFDQTLPASAWPRFAGRTVMLIDEHAVSQSEHSAMMFKVLGGTTFVGSPTVGANGDVTYVALPGRATMSMTGQSVQWPDGATLQGVGVQPDIAVRPTARGLASGIDEVLTAAFRHLGGQGDIAFSDETTHDTFPAARVGTADRALGPPRWIVSSTSSTGAYQVSVDTLVESSVAGAPPGSLHIRFLRDSSTFGNAMQMLRADPYRGKRITYSGYLRTRDVPATPGGAALWLRVDNTDGTFTLDNMHTRLVVGTTPWTRVSITVDVPETALGVSVGVLFSGKGGEVWADDLDLRVVSHDTPLTAIATGRVTPAQASQMSTVYRTVPLVLQNPSFQLRP